ncbi:MAG TPA: RNA polymerase sigma factor [Blastocatellia bacterium]|nr:RNA polymerase sigma factor [Blastocatellia bacterium]
MSGRLSETAIETQFNAILDEYGQFLRNAVNRLCPKDAGIHVNEIEQEAKIRLWKALQSEREINELSSYIYRIASTTVIDAIRKVRARREESLYYSADQEDEEEQLKPFAEAGHLAPDRQLEQKQTMYKVAAALAQLPENRRQVVSLYLKGMFSQEIADLLGWSEAKARNLLYRGLKDLREQLKAEGIDCEIE